MAGEAVAGKLVVEIVGDVWQLQPGENIVTYSAASGSAAVTIEYASRYTGV